jgi:hypothetical protein
VTVLGPVDEATKRAVLAAGPLSNLHNTLTAGPKVSTTIAARRGRRTRNEYMGQRANLGGGAPIRSGTKARLRLEYTVVGTHRAVFVDI